MNEYIFHQNTHTSIYECDTCKVTFKKREAVINHMEKHRELSNNGLQESSFVCVLCGSMFPDENTFRLHTDLKHYKKYACHYCGRTYRAVLGLEKHIAKHEMYLNQDTK